jgi:predicted ATPase/DNA-binding winged helix-turn-helix (wHTH) protein
MNMYVEHAPAFFAEDIVSFGSLQLNRTKRLLARHGERIALGSRAMEILMVLTEKAGAIVSNRELLRRIWPDVIVEHGTIRVHVAQLRKALRNAEPDSDYVHNVTGRGYRFVAPVMRHPRVAAPAIAQAPAPTVLKLPLRQPLRRNNLPRLMTSMFGNEQTSRALADLVKRERFVTVTGAGGGGKTTVAICAADALAATYAHGVCFLDLASIQTPQALWSMLASLLGLSQATEEPLSQVLTTLSRHSMLLVLDNCEHVIEAATLLAEGVLEHCPQVSVLATSREPLRARGEIAYKLAPLTLPAAFDQASRKNLMDYPAIQLFVERAGAYADTELDGEALSRVAQVCQRLAGNPLAIEIAAGQVRWLGLRVLSAGLHDAMYLSMEGRRTADSRHRTLRANLDWSHGLLSREEQVVFRRLSVMSGSFDPDRAAAVIADEQLTPLVVLECLASLARKSLLVLDTSHDVVSYRLDELCRAYASEQLHQARELSFMYRRYAQVWRRVGLERIHAHARLWHSPARTRAK